MVPPGAESFDYVGTAVAIDGEVAVVTGGDTGHVFERDVDGEQTWLHVKELEPSESAREDQATISGDTSTC